MLEELLDKWKAKLSKLEDKWWDLNFPDPARRAQEKILSALARVETGELQAGAEGSPKLPLPQGPPPTFTLPGWWTHPKLREWSGKSALRLLRDCTQSNFPTNLHC